MEKKMETLGPFKGIYRGCIGIMEKKMETIIVDLGFRGFRVEVV